MEAPSGYHRSSPTIAETELLRNDGVPTVLAAVGPDGTSLIWTCPACRDRGKPARHTHGDRNAWLRAAGDLVGHRVAHCWSPEGQELFAGGVYIKVSPSSTATATDMARVSSKPKRRHIERWLTFEEARKIVHALANKEDRFYLLQVVANSSESDDGALSDSRTMTVGIHEQRGVTLQDLISELAMLRCGGPVIDYQAHRDRIEKLVVALAKECLQ